MSSEPALRDKVALVTGASSGIGRAVALALAARGCRLVIAYHSSSSGADQVVEEIRALGGEAMAVSADLALRAHCHGLIEASLEVWGSLDFLINSAGTTSFLPIKELDAVDEDLWDRVLAVNLKAPFFLAQAAAPALRGNRGAIVNISSTAALNSVGSCIPYAAAKAALNNLTLSLARALAPEVRVNAVAPGFVDTPWVERGLGERLGSVRKWIAKQTPLGRVTRPEDVAAAVLGLLAMPNVTGQILTVDGGYRLRE